MPEVGLEEYRHIVYGNYRIVYRISARTIFHPTVRHFSRLLDLEELKPES